MLLRLSGKLRDRLFVLTDNMEGSMYVDRSTSKVCKSDGKRAANEFYFNGRVYYIDFSEVFLRDYILHRWNKRGIQFFGLGKDSLNFHIGGVDLKLGCKWLQGGGIVEVCGERFLEETLFVFLESVLNGGYSIGLLGYSLDEGGIHALNYLCKNGLYSMGGAWRVPEGSPLNGYTAMVDLVSGAVTGWSGVSVMRTEIGTGREGVMLWRVLDIKGLGCLKFLCKQGSCVGWDVLWWSTYWVLDLASQYPTRVILLKDDGKVAEVFVEVGEYAAKCVFDRPNGVYRVYNFVNDTRPVDTVSIVSLGSLAKEYMLRGRVG